MKGIAMGDLAVGQAASWSKTISESDIYTYAGVTGDFNPAHLDEAYARGTHFKTRIAHGMLSAGLVSALLGTQLPGPGTIYLSQALRFLAPVRIGETITARVEITGLQPERNRVTLRTTVSQEDGTLVLDGEAEVLAPRP